METLRIQDASTTSWARILPGFGFNCFDLSLMDGFESVPIFWTPEGFGTEAWRGYLGGMPVLVPFAGRIGNGRFRFLGRQYELPSEDGMGNALHGQAFDRPWRVAARGASRAVGVFRASEVLGTGVSPNGWPADYEVSVAYEILAGVLTCTFSVRNVDPERTLPCGFGLHPYLRAAFSGDGTDRPHEITVPARASWELDARLLPTGRRRAVAGNEDLRRGRSLSGLQLDHVFGDLEFVDRTFTVWLKDPARGRRVWMRCSEAFRCCVVFTPPGRQAVCIEPYTCVPDAFALEERGVGDTGLRTLEPGESFGGWVAIGLEEADAQRARRAVPGRTR